MNTNQALLYERLQEAAKAGERAPFNDCVQGGSVVFSALVRAGHIIVEVYDKNWRTVEITATGRRTKECPHAKKPYKVISKESFITPSGKKIPSPAEREAAAMAVTSNPYTK